jgi:hypothetical protein
MLTHHRPARKSHRRDVRAILSADTENLCRKSRSRPSMATTANPLGIVWEIHDCPTCQENWTKGVELNLIPRRLRVHSDKFLIISPGFLTRSYETREIVELTAKYFGKKTLSQIEKTKTDQPKFTKKLEYHVSKNEFGECQTRIEETARQIECQMEKD